MNILILGSYAPSLLNFRGPLIEEIIAHGHIVSVGAPDISSELRSRLEVMGVNVYETPMERTGTGVSADISYYRGLCRLIKKIKPDAVLTYTIKPNIWGSFASSNSKIPSYAMITGLGYAFTDSGGNPPLRKKLVRFFVHKLYRAATKRNRRVLFQNPDDLEDFMKVNCLSDLEKACLINGSGVDMVHYSRVPMVKDPVVLMIARLLRNKGVREYAEAALMVLKSHPDARFQLVGPFDEGPDSITQADLENWVAQGLEYLGPMSDVRTAIAQCRIYVLPSYREGTPRSVLEAMAMGRPVITTDVPGCRETVRDGVNGHLVPVRNSGALAAAICRLLDNPIEAEAMGDAAFELVSQKYDVRLVNRQIMEMIGLPQHKQGGFGVDP